ncbi:MAG: hypothetical protein CMQ39_07740 [Gammaproteobacteria bacterium]|nr:hypothetical protein [Gammaproteobacteria bacterium]
MLVGLPLNSLVKKAWRKEVTKFDVSIDPRKFDLSIEEIIAIADGEDVDARLITNASELSFGPFEEQDIKRELSAEKSILLVQGLEQYFKSVRMLIASYFDFIPAWQLDDVMGSVNYNSTSCGAHFDQYDVFLLQHTGEKKWHFDEMIHCDEDLDENSELRLLKHFSPTNEVIAREGDLIYVPPGVGHHGQAAEASITLSIGIRNPTPLEILGDFSSFLMSEQSNQAPLSSKLFSGEDEISDKFIKEIRAYLTNACSTENIEDWVGSYSTRLSEPSNIQPNEPARLKSKCLLLASLKARFAFKRRKDKTLFFVNGDRYVLNTSDLKWIADLTRNRECAYEPDVSSAGRNCIKEMLSSGAITIEEREH